MFEHMRQPGISLGVVGPADVGQQHLAVRLDLGELGDVGDAVLVHDLDLVAHLDDKGQITPAEWKGLTGASRKFSIPLAEYFDAQKVTLRVGDIRKLRG